MSSVPVSGWKRPATDERKVRSYSVPVVPACCELELRWAPSCACNACMAILSASELRDAVTAATASRNRSSGGAASAAQSISPADADGAAASAVRRRRVGARRMS